MNQEHADAVWVVSTHDTELEAREAEVTLALRHRLPTLPFVARATLGSERSLVADQASLDRIFAGADTAAAGYALLAAEGLDFDHPHFSAATTTAQSRIRRRLVVSLCGDRRGAGPQHRVALFGSDHEGRRALEAIGLSVRPARKGSAGWRHESSFADFGRLVERVEDIEDAIDVSLRFTARLGGARSAPKRMQTRFRSPVRRPYARAWSSSRKREATTSSSRSSAFHSSAPSTTWTSNARTTSWRMGSSRTTRSTRSAARTSATSSTSSATSAVPA